MTAVRVDHLSHTYPSQSRREARQALSDVSLNIESGRIFGVLGPNGGGKSTLFRILSTALKPTSGSATLFGVDVQKDPGGARKKIGVVFQNPSLDKKLTLRENLTHQGHLYGLQGTALHERVDSCLSKLSLLDRANDLVESLSGGMQRRAEIAKGLLHKPELLIMDEPSTGLDPGARMDMWDFLKSLNKEGMTILLTTHLMDEGDKCDRLIILHEGRTVADGTPDELKKRIGGDVITIQAKDAAALADKIRTTFGGNVRAMDATVRIEIQDGHKFIPSLVEAFPGVVTSVSLGKPTLEDVFAHETGRAYSVEGTRS